MFELAVLVSGAPAPLVYLGVEPAEGPSPGAVPSWSYSAQGTTKTPRVGQKSLYPLNRLRQPSAGVLARRLDGNTLDVADTADSEEAFGRRGASRGSSAFPKIRFVAPLENGPHVLWGARMADCATDQLTLAEGACPRSAKGCCAWRTGCFRERIIIPNSVHEGEPR